MRITKRYLKRIIKEELLREGSEIGDAFQSVRAYYDKARDELKLPPEELEKLENRMQTYWENTIKDWCQHREDPDHWWKKYQK
jgi:hypothetical protein